MPATALAAAALLAALASTAGCRSLAPVLEASPRLRYAKSLESAGLASRALASSWSSASRDALARPTPAGEALREVVHFDPARPTAEAYALNLTRGSRLTVRVTTEPADLPLFVELLRADEGGWDLVAAAEDGRNLEYAPRRDGAVVLLVQPELLAGGRVTVELALGGALGYPVAGANRSTLSGFGAPRDGGRRSHQGIDIGAPRGTPAVAAADSTVVDVGENALGGRIVRLLTDEGHLLYYAHLDRQLVRRGERVTRGQAVGEIGDTGNARGTTPHLHFEVRAEGETVDPVGWVRRPASPEALRADLAPLGSWMRIAKSGADLRATPTAAKPAAAQRLAARQATRVLAANGSYYRVRTPDGVAGYVASAAVEPVAKPLATRDLELAQELRSAPSPAGVPIARLEAGSKVELLAYSGASALMRDAGGTIGWASIP